MTNFIHEIASNKKTNFIILSAGENKTRGQHGNKSLVYVNKNQKLLDAQIKNIRKYSEINEIFVATGYQSGLITEYILKEYPDVRIVENKNYKKTTPLETLRLCLNCCLSEDTYIIYGDKYFSIDAINLQNRSEPAVVESTSNISKSDPGLLYQGDTLKRITYGIKNKWGQIFYIPKNLFYDFRHKSNNSKKKYYNVYDIINEVAKTYQFKIHKSKNIKEVTQ
jgi:choline kinase